MNERTRNARRATDGSDVTRTENSSVAPRELLSRAQGWGDVAREARDRLEQGANAMRALRLRRNRSGQ